MVLESILNPKSAEDKPLHVFIISIIFSFVGIFLAHNLFPTQSSILSIAFVTIFFVPFFQRLFLYEEQKDELAAKGKVKGNIFTRHEKTILVYSAFFFGVIVVYAAIFSFFPEIKEIFTLQNDWFKSLSGYATGTGQFERFFFNNTQVMMLFFVLSVLFGAGAVFILTWNASIIAVYTGLIINQLAPALGKGTAYVYGLGVGLSSIALHGVPEILGYFLAGIAGGLLSTALIREEFMSKAFNTAAKDALIWLASAEALIFIAAILEAAF